MDGPLCPILSTAGTQAPVDEPDSAPAWHAVLDRTPGGRFWGEPDSLPTGQFFDQLGSVLGMYGPSILLVENTDSSAGPARFWTWPTVSYFPPGFGFGETEPHAEPVRFWGELLATRVTR